MLQFKYIITFIFIGLHLSGFGQTCCSAGAPISSSLEIMDTKAKSLSLQLGYEYKSINLLIDNDKKLGNDPRSRSGQNLSLKVDYTLSKRWAFTALLPMVNQSRTTLSERQNSIGIGDLSLLSQFSVYRDTFKSVNISAGVKLPIGKTTHRGPSQIFLSPDMQSGSGSYDFLFRASYSNSDFLIPFLSNFTSVVYRANGVNEHFGGTANFEGRRFAFGDEFVVNTGLKYLQTYSFGFLIPDLSLKFRWSEANTEQQVDAPNSGGLWFSIPLGVSFVPDQSKSVRLYTEFPVYQNLKGLQITTDFVVGIQLNYHPKRDKY